MKLSLTGVEQQRMNVVGEFGTRAGAVDLRDPAAIRQLLGMLNLVGTQLHTELTRLEVGKAKVQLQDAPDWFRTDLENMILGGRSVVAGGGRRARHTRASPPYWWRSGRWEALTTSGGNVPASIWASRLARVARAAAACTGVM